MTIVEKLVQVIRSVDISGKTYAEYVEAIAEAIAAELDKRA